MYQVVGQELVMKTDSRDSALQRAKTLSSEARYPVSVVCEAAGEKLTYRRGELESVMVATPRRS